MDIVRPSGRIKRGDLYVSILLGYACSYTVQQHDLVRVYINCEHLQRLVMVQLKKVDFDAGGKWELTTQTRQCQFGKTLESSSNINWSLMVAL